jgi:hypothetical protein
MEEHSLLTSTLTSKKIYYENKIFKNNVLVST